MNKHRLLFFILVFFCLVATVIFSIFYVRQYISRILYLTAPVNSLTAKVEKIEGNVVTVSIPGPQSELITYRVIVGEKTSGLLSLDNIKVGQIITISTMTDLRTHQKDSFEATGIKTPPNIILKGKILKINGGVVTLQTQAPQKKEYLVSVDDKTDISGLSVGPTSSPKAPPIVPKEVKLSLSDLEKDMMIIVYTAGNVADDKNQTAVRIERLLLPEAQSSNLPFLNGPPPSSSVSAN